MPDEPPTCPHCDGVAEKVRVGWVLQHRPGCQWLASTKSKTDRPS